MYQTAQLIPEPYRSWLIHASEVDDDKERRQHLKEITAQLKAAHPELYREKE